MPHEVDEIELFGHRLGRPAATACLRISSMLALMPRTSSLRLLARECRRDEVVVRESRRWAESGWQLKLFDKLA